MVETFRNGGEMMDNSIQLALFEPESKDMKIDDIIVKDRLRDTSLEDEDYKQLKNDIKQNGLLQNIVVNQNKKLVSGYRRLQCCKELGYETIRVKVINTEGEEHERFIELSENVNRKNFTFSELMKAADELHEYVKKKAGERKSSKEPNKLDIPGLPPMSGRTSDIMAKILDAKLISSGRTYERAREIWKKKDSEEAKTIGEEVNEIIAKLDKGDIAINPALKQLENAEKKRSAGSGDGHAEANDEPDDTRDDEHDELDPLNHAKIVVEAFETLIQTRDLKKYEPNELDEMIVQLEALTVKVKEARDKMDKTT